MSERLIDIPIESLPMVDEHSISVDASPERVWEALLEVIGGDRLPTRAGARALRCEPGESAGEFGTIGSTVPGFIVARAIPPAVLALMGEHRFSRYALVFRITERIDAPVLLSAETRAEFGAGTGRAYRALVIGSRGHVLAVRRILRSVRRRAQRS